MEYETARLLGFFGGFWSLFAILLVYFVMSTYGRGFSFIEVTHIILSVTGILGTFFLKRNPRLAAKYILTAGVLGIFLGLGGFIGAILLIIAGAGILRKK